MSIKKFFLTSITCENLERSIAFYEKLGFRNVQQREVIHDNLQVAFGVDGHHCKYSHMQHGADENGQMLGLIEWISPPTEGEAIATQNHRGLTRIALLTDDCDGCYKELKAAGVEMLTTPGTVMTPQGGWRIFLCKDPDGVAIQFVQVVPPQS